jgi:hypothetical protein
MPIQHSQFHGYLSEAELAESTLDGFNSGTFFVRAHHFHALMAAWEAIDRTEPLRPKQAWDQPAGNRLLLDTPLKMQPLPPGQVALYFQNRDLLHLCHSPVVHYAGAGTEEKTVLMFAAYMARFHSGGDLPLLAMLER